jgi:hypothetical protein
MTHHLTGRTRYFHVKYHHFWDAHDQGLFEILPIPTKYQRGDYMMKGMVHVPFEHTTVSWCSCGKTTVVDE